MQVLDVEPRRLRLERPAEVGDTQEGIGASAMLLRNRRFLTISVPAGLGHLNGGTSKEEVIVAFKLQTNASKRFNVQPVQGYLRGGENVQITVQLKQGAGWSESDKFLVRGVRVADDRTPVQAVWEKQHSEVLKVIVRCEYFDKEDSSASVSKRGHTVANDGNNGPDTPASGNSASPFAPSTTALDLNEQLWDMLVKNHSILAEDRLERAELEELVLLRDRISDKQWRMLQKNAKQVALQRSNQSNVKAGMNGTTTSAPSLGSTGTSAAPTKAQSSLADLLVYGVSLLRERQVSQSASVFLQALDHAPVRSVAQAQVLVGLGSALESAGMVDRAIDCYIDALKIYENEDDADCRESVSSAIAHVYADMRDHTMAAAWFDYQLETISAVPGNGQRRASVTAARDHQMRLGHVSEPLLSAARGRVASHLASCQSRTALIRSSAETVALQQNGSQQQQQKQQTPFSQQQPSQQSAQGAVEAAQRCESFSSGRGLGRMNGLEALWEPSGVNGTPTYMSSSMSTDASNTSTINEATGAAPVSRRNMGSLSSVSSVRPFSGSSSSFSSSAMPHYLAPTTASRASSASFRDRGQHQQHASVVDSSNSDSERQTLTDMHAVRARNSAAAALHVRRSLEARRKRDQDMGIRAPKVESSSSSFRSNASLRSTRSGTSDGANRVWSLHENKNENRNSDASDLVVILEVVNRVDNQVYTVALPGPLSMTMDMTVREMRERVSFVTGVELHDFELIVANTRLSDSWVGRDIGLGMCTEVELHLLPGVRPSKYALPMSPMLTYGVQSSDDPHAVSVMARSTDAVVAVQTVAVPKRPPPIPKAEFWSSNSVGGGFAGLKVCTLNGQTQQPQTNDHDDHQTDQDRADIEDLCALVQSTLEKQRRATAYADEIGAKARLMLADSEANSDVDENGAEENGDEYPEMKASATDIGQYASMLMERVVALEAQLSTSDAKCVESEERLVVAQAKILDLAQVGTRVQRAREEINATCQKLKKDFNALSMEARASFSKFNTVLEQRIRAVQVAAAVVPQLVLVAQEDEDMQAFEKGGNGLWHIGSEEQPSQLFKARAMIRCSETAVSLQVEDSALASLTRELCDSILEGVVKTAFVVNLGQPMFFHTAPDTSLMLALVEALLQGMAPELQSTRVRAVVAPLMQPETPIDVLDPDQNASSNVSITVDETTRDVKIQNAGTVRFFNIQDFVRFYELVSTKIKATMPAHVFMVLENEHTQRRIVFIQVYGGSETTGTAPTKRTVLRDFLQAAGSCRIGTQTFVIAPAKQTVPGVTKLLETYFAPLVRSRND